jgi:hypothetical protein
LSDKSMNMDGQKLSTSALARLLDISLPQLFNTLKDYGWIRKVDDGWILTGKGEFEGGEYIQSKKYGRYIVWPEAIVEHPLMRGMTEHRLLTLGAIAKQFQLNAREIARVFAEQGLLEQGIHGWQPTDTGRQAGIALAQSDHYGQSYVLCPQDIIESDSVAALLMYLQKLEQQIHEGEQDLFAAVDQYVSLDGHVHISPYHQRVSDWLYLAGIVHATRHKELEMFYLPRHRVLIDIWNKDSRDTKEVSGHMQLTLQSEQSDLRLIQLMPEDFADLETTLASRLALYGVAVL